MNIVHSVAMRLVACLLLSSALAVAATPPPMPGTWHATLQTATGGLALEMTVRDDGAGALGATLESVDQAPGQAIPVTAIAVAGDQLTLALDALGASYAGRFDPASGGWQGEWRQGRTLPLHWLPGPLPAGSVLDGLDGEWRATLDRNGVKLRLVLHVATSARGTCARLDSPDAGLSGMDVSELRRDGKRIHFRVPLADVIFDGSLDESGSIEGRWRRQGMPETRVRFVRSAGAAASAAAVAPPAAYESVPVRFPNPAAGIALAGTLTRPHGAGPFAAAVLISGTGAHDRDGTMVGHKPFAVLADHLARRNIAVLRVDERGVGESEGRFEGATNADFASDTRAAVHFLATQPGIDRGAIGLLGHSQGGAVAPLAANGDPAIAFLVLLAAPGTSISELLLAQRRMTGVTQGWRGSALRRNEQALAALFAAAAQAPDRAAARARLAALLTPARLRDMGVTAQQQAGLVDEISSDWLRDLLRYDAHAALAAVRVPVLALNGSLDRQVPAAANLAAIRRALSGTKDVTVTELHGLNHLFQHAFTGRMSEYAEIKESFAVTAMDVIGDWIGARFPRPRGS